MTDDASYEAALRLIYQSRERDEVARAPWSEELVCWLAVMSDDSAETDTEAEYWGADWRVHLTGPRRD